MIVEKKTIRRYEVLNAVEKPFLKFGQFRKSRESIGLSVQRCCFNCNHKFKDDDDVYLVMLKGTLNKLFCKECNDKALNDFNKEYMNNIFTIAYSREEANEIGHFIMCKGYEGVQNDSYRYCDEEILFALSANSKHNIDHIYVGVCGCQMIVAKTKRLLRRKGLKYIEKKRVFYNLLKQY